MNSISNTQQCMRQRHIATKHIATYLHVNKQQYLIYKHYTIEGWDTSAANYTARVTAHVHIFLLMPRCSF